MANSKPKAVLITDVHYSLATLELANRSMLKAIDTANEMEVPLVVCGDLHDSKANMRAECVNVMLETFKRSKTQCYVLIGNHCKTHEKAETHALNFLAPYAQIVDQPVFVEELNAMLIPYQTDPDRFKRYLPDSGLVIAHQGVTGSDSGEYIQDRSAVNPEDMADLMVISGHYHRRQTIPLENGSWTYLGNPYTLGYGEADHPPKGYHILYDDNSLEFVGLDLRKHVILKWGWNNGANADNSGIFWTTPFAPKPEDLVWVKVEGTKEQLAKVTKEWLRTQGTLPEIFRLDFIPADIQTHASDARLNLSGGALIDSLVDSLSATSDVRKERIKSLWKALK